MGVEVAGLERRFGPVIALGGVSFDLRRGEITGLLGPNGAGKTTLLRILAGTLAPTAGIARVDGVDTVADPPGARARLGWLPEGAPAPDDLTAAGLLRFVGGLRGLGPAGLARAIERVVADCSLDGWLDRRIGALSRGTRQRVGLAAALLHDPAVLVLDEPTTGLDPNQVQDLRALIRRLGRDRTVLLSTHALAEVEATCDRVLVLHRGRLVADEPTDRVRADAREVVVQLALATGKVRISPEALVASLSALPGVSRVVPLAPGADAHRVEVHADPDPRGALFDWAVAHGHRLVELRPVPRTLVEVFRRLTEAA